MNENPLQILLNPRSIATVGASNNLTKMGTIQALSIIKDGFPGKFYPLHPTEKTVLGHQAYASAYELPEPPDLVMLVVPTDQIPTLLEDFGKIGTQRAIIISAGFKETGEEGLALEKRLNEIAAVYGMRFIGPNCMGFLNSQKSLNMTVTYYDGRPGMLGLVSQSGTYVTQALSYLRKRGIRFSKAVSTGNEANISIIDVLEYLAEDEDTKAIILYIEGLRDGRRFLEAARKITPRKPVLAQYVGGSAAGARAGLSHTGAMAGPDFLYDGIFKQAGIIRLQSIEDLYAHGWALATQPPLRGNRLGVLTNSGGPGTAISHQADSGGMAVPQFSEALQSQIRPLIPSHASTANPVDLTFYLDMAFLSETLPEMIMKSGEVDAVIVHGAMMSGFMKDIHLHIRELIKDMPLEDFLAPYYRDFTNMVSLPWKYQTPMLISTFMDREDNYAAAYQDHNIPVFDSPEKAARAMVTLLQYKKIREREAIASPLLPEPKAEAGRIIQEALNRGQRALDEHEGKQILAAYGIPVTRETRTTTPDEAVAAAHRIGYPVAVKACAWEIMHKAGKGLIALDVRTDEGVRQAFQDIQRAAGKPVSILVQEMISGGRELMAGMTRFPAFGPCVMFGLGGIYTEVLKDTTIRSAPLCAAEAGEMLSDIRAQAILGEFRGMPPVSRSEMILILQGLGHIALLHPEVAEIDLNPVILAGSRPVVTDALFILRGP